VEEPVGIFAFPKGAKAGTFLHEVFEHLDFYNITAASAKDLVGEKLAQYGYDRSWLGAVCDMVDKVLKVPLDPEEKDFRLSSIRMEDRLNELEFYFPLRILAPETVGRISGRRLLRESRG
jgi:exodeoxyribonuclease V beta subunit